MADSISSNLSNISKDVDTTPVILINGITEIKSDVIETVVFIPVDRECDNFEIKQEIKVELEDIGIKEESNSGVNNVHNQDENSNKCKTDLENKAINDHSLSKDNSIQEEIVTSLEMPNNNHKNLNNNFMENTMVIIKDEFINPEFQEESVNLINETSVHTQNLYTDHIFKEEIAIGPEIVQKVQQYVPKHLHKNLKSYITKTDNGKRNFICEYCQVTFRYSGDIKEHVKQHESHEKSNMVTRNRKKNYLNQKKSKSGQTKSPAPSSLNKKTEYFCDGCKKKFTSKKPLQHHVNFTCSTAEYEHKCKECGKCFTNPGNLARHMHIHTGKKPHTCEQCNLTFGRKDYLSFHIRKHHSGKLPGEKDLICDQCGKGLSSKCNLNYHRKFTCPKLKEKTKPVRNKSYTCDMCERSYPYRTSLRAHIMRRHTDTVLPSHQCNECGRKYLKKHNLQCHMLSKHMNKKPYPCSKCSESFTWQSTLTSHERKRHNRHEVYIKTEKFETE